MPERLEFFVAGLQRHGPYDHAEHLQAVVLDWIDAAAPETAAAVHDANQVKPLAVSPVWEDRERRGACFEVAALTDEMGEMLRRGVRARGSDIRLGARRWRIEPPRIVKAESFQTLLGWHRETLRTIDMHVDTPTAHHEPGELRKSVVLPSPERYFGSWLGRWNVCCETAIHPAILQVVERQVAISHCAGATETLDRDSNRPFIGFTGAVRFTVLRPHKVTPEEARCLAALARFAEYCGTGVRTMRGMGQTTLLALR